MAGEALATGSLNEAVYGSGAGATGASMFSSMLGYVGLAYGIYNMISSGFAYAEQKKQQAKLAKAQKEQANLLREKIKADNTNLYSSAISSVSQTSGAMGAVY